jgi:hypothetical protein
MKRFIIVLSCLSIFYAGAVWALEGCGDFSADVHAAHHTEKEFSLDHHYSDAAPHHSHSDPSKVHCPNVLGEFLISPRATLTSNPGHVSHLDVVGQSVREFLSDLTSRGYGDGPPGSVHLKALPRHLLLSVIRI